MWECDETSHRDGGSRSVLRVDEEAWSSGLACGAGEWMGVWFSREASHLRDGFFLGATWQSPPLT